MYLFFDTETTGFPSKSLPLEHEKQARICQLGAIVTDAEGHTMAELNVIIKPDGWVVPPFVAGIHGITTEKAAKFGIPIATAVNCLDRLAAVTDIAVAHNFPFDDEMLALESAGFHPLLGIKQTCCTMRASTELCKLPGKNGGFKWPKLQELYKFLFGHEFIDAHDAMADVRALKECFFELKRRGIIAI